MTQTNRSPECYREGDTWYLVGRHERTCTDTDCAGCTICHRHCTCRVACAEHIDQDHPRTAPRCIGRARESIKAIRRLHLGMLAEAIRRGVHSEAANLAGPALASSDAIEANGHRQLSIVMGRIKGEVEPHSKHPLVVLGWWDMAFREDYGQRSDKRITVANTADYLESMLDTVAQDPDQDWPAFVRELADCRAHLEAVLHDSGRPETGAPCPTCSQNLAEGKKAPRLQKRVAEHTDLTLRKANRVCELGTLVDEYTGRSRCSTCRGDDDTWHCPDDPEHWWTDPDYRARIDGTYLESAEYLPARELAERLGVAPSTVRSWIAATRHITLEHGLTKSDAKLKPAGKINGRNVYSVKEAEKLKKPLKGQTA